MKLTAKTLRVFEQFSGFEVFLLLSPVVGLAFVWNTIRTQDMVTVGTTTPDEAREVIELSLDLLNRQLPDNKLQATRSKKSLQ